MSIKRISRKRVVAQVTQYVDEDPSATTANARVGGDVETKASLPLENSIEADMQSRLGSDIETRTSPNVEYRVSAAKSRGSV